jgi:glutamate---cysteine ligase / carboxylate-amine ligase
MDSLDDKEPGLGLNDDNFGKSSPLSIGVEEELLLVDERLRLSPSSEQVLAAVGNEERSRVTPELFAEQIELKTDVCGDPSDAERQLRGLRRAVRDLGFGLLAVGLHPTDGFDEAPIVRRPRYIEVHEDLRGLLWTPPCGLHVHVGMPDPETAVQVANAMRHHLPMLQALTANSPFWAGVDSGLASARTAVVRSYPRFQIPRAFRDYEDFCAVVAQAVTAAGVEDYTYIWWDVRLHPRLGTLEIRAFDTQTTPAENAAVAALIRALAAREIDRGSTPPLFREALEESYFQASRYGLQASLLGEDGVRLPAEEMARRMLEEARPYARELGGDESLSEIDRTISEGNGADGQRRTHRAAGMEALLEELAERTAEGRAEPAAR